MDHQIETKQLPAIQISPGLSICHMLFADDVGIFIPATEPAFNSLRICIAHYEEASGAKLNIQKSIITPIAIEGIPDWIHNTGCAVANDGEIHKYLGAPFGVNLSTAAVQNFCLDKLAKRITTLRPKSISYTGRVQLIKQVLLAMPVYHMMYTHMRKSTTQKLNRMCREFLWGFNKAGNRKVPLVAWERLIKLRKHGGLGIKDTTAHALALMARWPVKLIADPKSTWSKLFQANLESLPWSHKKRNRWLGYSFLDKVVFFQPSRFGKLHYTKNIWFAWEQLQQFLSYKFKGNDLPSHWAVEDVIKLTPSIRQYSPSHQKRIVNFLGKLQVKTVKDLWDNNRKVWKNFDRKLYRIRGLPDWIFNAIKSLLNDIHEANSILAHGTSEPAHWKWQGHKKPGIQISASKVYHLMLNSSLDSEQLNRWWHSNDMPLVWKARWLLLWAADIALKGRTFLWRVLANGLFTGARANKIIPGSGICMYCNQELETITHLFFTCPYAQEVWQHTARFYGAPLHNNLVSSSQSFIELLDQCLGSKAVDTARILILYETVYMIWQKCNKQLFQGTPRTIATHQTANLVKLHALAILNYTTSLKKKKWMSSALQFIQNQINRNAGGTLG
jgi:hypothetical protein